MFFQTWEVLRKKHKKNSQPKPTESPVGFREGYPARLSSSAATGLIPVIQTNFLQRGGNSNGRMALCFF